MLSIVILQYNNFLFFTLDFVKKVLYNKYNNFRRKFQWSGLHNKILAYITGCGC